MTLRALDGVKVLDFCWVGAGPLATKMLADHGADVVKVESRHKPDGLRLTPPFAGGQRGVDRSGYFADRNTNKRSLALNLSTEKGRAVARALVARCDIVSNSYTPGVMERFGLGYEAVAEINPRAIYLSMSMHGLDGPERSHLGYGMMINAVTGLHYLTSYDSGEPIGIGTNYPDHVPNPCHAAFAVLAALRHQRRTGEGQLIDVAETEAVVPLMGAEVLDFTLNDRESRPMGNRDLDYPVQGVFPCARPDDWLALSIVDASEWDRFVAVVGMTDPPRWQDLPRDEDGRTAVERAIATATRSWEVAELDARLADAGVAAARVGDISVLVDHDPQLAHRGHWIRLPHAEMGESLYNAPPFRFSGQPAIYERGAPLLGEHTREVCRQWLDMPGDTVEQLITSDVLA